MNKIDRFLIAMAVLFTATSCDKFLDVLPDNRIDKNSEEKVKSILVSAYPTTSPTMIAELSSDNMVDNGSLFSPYNLFEKPPYLWEDILTNENDDPFRIWESSYKSIAAANEALLSLEALEETPLSKALRAEALLCRAYNHFVLVNIFSMHYNPETANKDLGIPYVTELENRPLVEYQRGTVEQVYQKINMDIEAALPDVIEDYHETPKYHFNPDAAYAFAARFNLYYLKYDKVIEYASKVVGTNPAIKLRDYVAYAGLNWQNLSEEYVKSMGRANLLLMQFNSSWPYVHWYGSRYGHSKDVCSAETINAAGPWGTSGAGGNIWYSTVVLSATDQAVFYPKSKDFFEYTNKTAKIGYLHLVQVVFSVDETLLCRAEAYVMQQKYDAATADLAAWMASHCKAKTAPLTRETINTFYSKKPYTKVPSEVTKRTIKKHLNPMGFTVQPGEQENFVHCLLHFRRLETLHEGQRWYDVKRYGIEVDHPVADTDPVILKRDDPRRAIQLPQEVITRGLAPNPR